MDNSLRTLATSLMLILAGVVLPIDARADCDYPTCVPSKGEVCLFQDADCNGLAVKVKAFTMQGPTIWDALGSGTFPNDALSSWLLGDHTELFICRHANFGTGCQAARRDDTYGIAQSQEWMPKTYCGENNQPLCNDMASSIRVSQYEVKVVNGSYGGNNYCLQPESNTCAFFTESARETGHCVALPLGNRSGPGNFGLPQDTISSILCGTSVKAYIYEHVNFGGSMYASPYIDIGYLGTANDKTSSLKVVWR